MNSPVSATATERSVAVTDRFVSYFPPATPTTQAGLDAALRVLSAQRQQWVSVDIPERIALLDAVRRDLLSVAERWANVCAAAKGLQPSSAAAAEEWQFVALLFHHLRVLRRSLHDIARYGRPRLPQAINVRPDGQVVAPVFPQTRLDKLVFPQVSAEVWLPPDGAAAWQQAQAYRERREGRVALVLGAGNISALAPADLLYKLFVENQVVLLKPNPINDYLGPLFTIALRSLIARGFVQIVYGGAAEGDYLAQHPLVDTVHMTGSDRTYMALVYGTGAEGARRKARGERRLHKPVTAELGGVSPMIIVPGPWSDADIKARAADIATTITNNAGFNCLTPRVLIQHREWAQRMPLLEAIGDALAAVPTRPAYYPGAAERHAAFVAAHPAAWQAGTPQPGHLPWTFVPDVNPQHRDDICFTTEAFCGLCAETALSAPDLASFLEQATAFANTTLHGSLCATLLVHPETLRDPAAAAAIEHAIGGLRYGTVTTNLWSSISYLSGVTSWGEFDDAADPAQSLGSVNNYLMLHRPQKSVARAPFNMLAGAALGRPRRPWAAGRQLAAFEANPSPWRMAALVLASL